VADTFTPVNRVAVLLEASRGGTRSASAPVVFADPDVENVDARAYSFVRIGAFAHGTDSIEPLAHQFYALVENFSRRAGQLTVYSRPSSRLSISLTRDTYEQATV
jgi:hypothetical protein